MKFKLFFCSLLLAFGMSGLLTGCEKEGPMEKAGSKVDEAVDKIDGEGPAEEVGETLDETAEEAKEEARQLKEKAEESIKN
ncbi:hypothetical protein [Desulfuromonas sp. AOP6]|uniref:hypothetical protein n=1 Tax=Desulfuromonas sp. AOP6 TaxID=1566351 RepID=UPI001283850C|nr:hypothetical protein [Desulfuromonas sp. AOP6]BCA78438.1 hypothetical protein AOP6_0225 [Desulfuromonas sp. AOP6]